MPETPDLARPADHDVRWKPIHTAILLAILCAAVVPRFVLSVFNRESNDQHMVVVERILEHDRLPTRADCWQCYHPKLFHWSAARVVELLDIESPRSRRVAAQQLNFLAALGTLAFAWGLLGHFARSPSERLAAFGLIALNPRFNGITAQATNDAFVILLGVASTYFFWRYLQQSRPRWLLGLTISLIAMSAAKAQGLVFFAMIATLLGVKLASMRGNSAARRQLAAGLAFLTVAGAATIPFAGQYYTHYRSGQGFLEANWKAGPEPGLFEKTVHRRPGILSYADGFLTFRILDLVQNPVVDGKLCTVPRPEGGRAYDPNCAAHRTSLWSQLYGRSQFLHFIPHPRSWRTDDWKVIQNGRAILLLGLVPLAILLLGIFLSLRDCARGLAKHGRDWLAAENSWALLAIFGGSLVLVAQLARTLRDYSSMKAIYLFPAFAVMGALYLRGLRDVVDRLEGIPGALPALWGTHAILMALYVLDIAWLAERLRLQP